MKIKLIHKISIGICLIVVGLTIAVMAIGNRFTTKAIEGKIRKNLLEAEDVFKNFQNLRLEDLKSNIALLSEIPHLKAVVTTPDIDHTTVLDSALSIQQIIHSDQLIISDAQGKLLASVNEPRRYGDDLSQEPVFIRALQGQSFEGIWIRKDVVYQIVVHPLLLGNEVRGTLLLGFAIDQSMIDNLTNMSNAQAALVVGGKMITSNIGGDVFHKIGKEALIEDLKPELVQTRNIDGERYLLSKVLVHGKSQNDFYILARSLDKELLFYRDLQGALLIAVGGIFIVALIFGMYYSKRITRPIESLVDGVKRISKGDLDAQVPITSTDEIGDLAGSFNNMTKDLKKMRDGLLNKEKELMLSNEELMTNESLLRKTLTNLADTQERLFQSEKLKVVGQLSAGVAHEVKNPLAIILMGVGLIRRRITEDDERVNEMLKDMEKAVNRANTVVKGLLDLSSQSELALQPADINELISSALLLVKYEFDQKKIKIIKEYKESNLEILIDKSKMEQVFVNIFVNSVQAMPEGGTIKVTTDLKTVTKDELNVDSEQREPFGINEKVVSIKIEDTGVGIPEDIISNIFDPFFTTKRSSGGTGLGLAIIKNIIELHQGKIRIANRIEGGAKTTILLKQESKHN